MLVTEPPSFLDRVHAGLRTTIRAALVGATVLTAFRVVFLLRHAAPGFPYRAADVARALLMGARFDLKVAALLGLPLAVLVPLCGSRTGRAVPWAWAVLAGFAIALTSMVNDGYYGYFHVPIDPLVFGAWEDDTAASSLSDHPVVLGTLAAVALGVAQAWVVLRRSARPGWPATLRLAVVLLALPALFLAIRGRIGGSPLKKVDLAATGEPFLDAAIPNGAFALFVAVEERNSVQIGDDPYLRLRKEGFRTPAEAAAVLGLAAPGASDEAVAEALFTRTPENAHAAAHPPHVVVVMMESFGTDVLRYHSARNDVLGRLAPHLARALRFENFVSAQNGTHTALESVLLSTPITPLTMGEPGRVEFEQSVARPFREAGYRTVFGFAWSGSWRGWGRTLPLQGYDEVHDRTSVLAAAPDVPQTIRGVPDEALFRWAAQRLRQADARGERLFLVLMAATNHSPHRLPDGYVLKPLDPGVFAGRAMADPSQRDPRLRTYQYAADAMGGFLDTLQAEGFLERTVVAATGDHTTRGFFEYPEVKDLPLRNAVPFVLWAPEPYLAGRTVDRQRWGSHRDVFPTLASLTLSRARIFRSGEDLLAPPTREPRALFRYDTVLTAAGAIPSLGTPESYCFDPDGVLTAKQDACAPALAAIRREERAYVGLLDWFVRRQAIGARARRPQVAAGAPAPGAAAAP